MPVDKIPLNQQIRAMSATGNSELGKKREPLGTHSLEYLFRVHGHAFVNEIADKGQRIAARVFAGLRSLSVERDGILRAVCGDENHRRIRAWPSVSSKWRRRGAIFPPSEINIIDSTTLPDLPG